MKTVNIKGKAYVEVNERVKYFRSNYEGWSIETELLDNTNGVAIIKATVKDDKGVVRATGHAYEKEDDKNSFVNSTSYIENCETSAVGRALGLLGIGIDTSIASSDEVQNAMANQQKQQSKNGLDFDDLRLKYSKMTKDELRKEYVSVKVSKAYTDKQKEAIGKMILKAQEGK